MTILGIIIIVIIVLSLVSVYFRNQITILRLRAEPYLQVVRSFLRISLVAFSLIFILIMLGLLLKSPTLIGFGFALAVLAVAIFWLPLGIIEKVFVKGSVVFPDGIRGLMGWLAFFGFAGMLYPNLVSNIPVLLGSIFVAIIFWGLTEKYKQAARPWGIFLTVIMIIIGTANYLSPAFGRYMKSETKKIDIYFNVRTASNEFTNIETYIEAKVNAPLYEISFKDDKVAAIAPLEVDLPAGAVALIPDINKEPVEFDGQSFTEIKICDRETGSFVGSPKCYISTGQIFIVDQNKAQKILADGQIDYSRVSEWQKDSLGFSGGTLSAGTYWFSLTARQQTQEIFINPNCIVTICTLRHQYAVIGNAGYYFFDGLAGAILAPDTLTCLGIGVKGMHFKIESEIGTKDYPQHFCLMIDDIRAQMDTNAKIRSKAKIKPKAKKLRLKLIPIMPTLIELRNIKL